MVKEDLVSDGWTEAFRMLFGSVREKAPSKAKLASWALTAPFSSDLYSLGLKQYMTNKTMAYIDLPNAMQMADFQKMEKQTKTNFTI